MESVYQKVSWNIIVRNTLLLGQVADFGFLPDLSFEALYFKTMILLLFDCVDWLASGTAILSSVFEWGTVCTIKTNNRTLKMRPDQITHCDCDWE